MTPALQVHAGPRAGQGAELKVVPGWLDKSLRHRHATTARLANVVLLAPNPEWVKSALPNARLPDRSDFKAYGDDFAGRERAWTRAIKESRRLADELAELVQQPSIEALSLA